MSSGLKGKVLVMAVALEVMFTQPWLSQVSCACVVT